MDNNEKEKAMKHITLSNVRMYERIRSSGITNMFSHKRVSEAIGVEPIIVELIQEEYDKILRWEEYCGKGHTISFYEFVATEKLAEAL